MSGLLDHFQFIKLDWIDQTSQTVLNGDYKLYQLKQTAELGVGGVLEVFSYYGPNALILLAPPLRR